MTDQNDIERYCRNCVSRDFVNGRGLVCKRTGAIPAFVGECESYQKDEELEKMAPTPKPEDYSGYVDREKLLAEENLPKAVLFGVLACIAGAVAWALISISTGYQMGYMAIGVGFLVGFAMRQGNTPYIRHYWCCFGVDKLCDGRFLLYRRFGGQRI